MPSLRAHAPARIALVGMVFALLAVAGAGVGHAAPAKRLAAADCVYAAHRGFKAAATENGMNAFKDAVAEQANYLEMDVQVTKDGYFTLMHDETIDRTTNGSGRIIHKRWKRLHKHVLLNDGETLPRLKAVLAMAEPTTTDVLLELKWVPSKRLPKFMRLVDAFGADRVVVNSFSTHVLSTFHKRYPSVRTALDTNGRISVASAASYGGVMPDWRHVTDKWLAKLKAAQVPAYLWTVDTPDGWDRFTGKVTLMLTNKDAAYDAWRAANCA